MYSPSPWGQSSSHLPGASCLRWVYEVGQVANTKGVAAMQTCPHCFWHKTRPIPNNPKQRRNSKPSCCIANYDTERSLISYRFSWHVTTPIKTIQHNTTRHNTTPHNTTRHNTTQREPGGRRGTDKSSNFILMPPENGLCLPIKAEMEKRPSSSLCILWNSAWCI